MSEAFEDFRRGQEEAAAERFANQEAERRRNIKAIGKPGGIADVNPVRLLASRLDRLTRYLAGEQLPTSPAQVPGGTPEQVIEAALERAATSADLAAPVAAEAEAAAAEAPPAAAADPAVSAADTQERAGAALEKIINTPDFVGIHYLEAGVVAGRAVCRVDIRDEGGRASGYGRGLSGLASRKLAPQSRCLDPTSTFTPTEGHRATGNLHGNVPAAVPQRPPGPLQFSATERRRTGPSLKLAPVRLPAAPARRRMSSRGPRPRHPPAVATRTSK